MSAKDYTLRLVDGLKNALAGLGTERDKAAQSKHSLTDYSYADLIESYRGAWLPRKIVDIPAFDATRNWRTWDLPKGLRSKVEAEERRVNLKKNTLDWMISGRLFGGSAMYIRVQGQDPASPLRPSSVRKGQFKGLTILNHRYLMPGPIDYDIDSPYFGHPEYWRVALVGKPAMMDAKIHPSRLIFHMGNGLPAGYTDIKNGWGDSVLTSVLDSLLQSDSAVANVASLLFEAKNDVVKIPDMMMNMSDPEYEKNLMERMAIAAASKGNNGMLVLDKEEEYTQKKMTFTGIPDIMDRFFQNVSGAADIPMTRLWGQSPAGMNATGDSDLKNYYDSVNARQELELRPAFVPLDEVILRSALGYMPRNAEYEWNSLWQQTNDEKAETGRKSSETFKNLSESGIFTQEQLQAIAVNEYTEIGLFPGIGQAVEDHPGLGTPAGAAGAPAAPTGGTTGGRGQGGRGTPPQASATLADAAPRTLYVSRKVLNAQDIIDHYERQGFNSTIPAEEMHVTIVYSRDPVDWMKVGSSWDSTIEVPMGGPRLMEQFDGGAKVLLFYCQEVQWRHEWATEIAEASWDYDEYQPHITISYSEDNPSVEDVEPYQGEIVLGPEIFEEITPAWKSGERG